MNRSQVFILHKQGRIFIDIDFYSNDVPSMTDPTQDIPIESLIVAQRSGRLPDTAIVKLPYNGIHDPSSLSSIDRQLTDKFDALNEYRESIKPIAKNVNNGNIKISIKDKKVSSKNSNKNEK